MSSFDKPPVNIGLALVMYDSYIKLVGDDREEYIDINGAVKTQLERKRLLIAEAIKMLQLYLNSSVVNSSEFQSLYYLVKNGNKANNLGKAEYLIATLEQNSELKLVDIKGSKVLLEQISKQLETEEFSDVDTEKLCKIIRFAESYAFGEP